MVSLNKAGVISLPSRLVTRLRGKGTDLKIPESFPSSPEESHDEVIQNLLQFISFRGSERGGIGYEGSVRIEVYL